MIRPVIREKRHAHTSWFREEPLWPELVGEGWRTKWPTLNLCVEPYDSLHHRGLEPRFFTMFFLLGNVKATRPLPVLFTFFTSATREREHTMTPHRLNSPWTILFTALVLMMLLSVWPASAQAGCNMNLYVKNTGKNPILIYGNASRVKTKGGLWKSLRKAGWVPTFTVQPGRRVGDDWKATFKCQAKRRYQIKYQCLRGPFKKKTFTTYYPGSTNWTTGQSILVHVNKCG